MLCSCGSTGPQYVAVLQQYVESKLVFIFQAVQTYVNVAIFNTNLDLAKQLLGFYSQVLDLAELQVGTKLSLMLAATISAHSNSQLIGGVK
jgi:hypothetical protein